MSSVDEELARAVEGDGDAGAPVVAGTRGDEPRGSTPRRNLGLLLALIVIAAAVGALVLLGFENAAVYAKTVDQLMASRSDMAGRRVRVQGTLVHGTLQRRDEPCEYRFQMQSNGSVLNVRYPQCVVPDTFRDRPETDVEVTVEGKLGSDSVFQATQIMAKCPSRYEEKNGAAVPVWGVGAAGGTE